jgi:DNA repair protein RecO (recombination protein O)
MYTEQFGLQSYIINSVRKKHPKHHANLFQPLTPVDLIVYHKDKPGLHRISEIRANPPLAGIPFDVLKTSIIFFLDEVLYKSIREEEPNQSLFDFIVQSVEWLDHSHNPSPDFHLVFLVLLSRYLGFGPSKNYDAQNQIFNLRDGHFQSTYPDHPNFIAAPLSHEFSKLLGANYSSELSISNADRKMLIDFLIEYYELHIEGFRDIKSKKVLEEIWN